MDINAVVIDGVIYELSKTEYENINDFAKKEIDSYKEHLREEIRKRESFIQEEVELEKFELRRKYNLKIAEISKIVKRLKSRKNSIDVPSVSYNNMVRYGMSVIYDKKRGYVWSCNILYSPKRIGGKYIKESYINKMATIVKLVCEVDPSSKHINDLVLYKVYGGDKFKHYHGYSGNRDCWGNFDYFDITIKNENDFLKVSKDIESLLEDINNLSIATRSPRDLPRLSTLQANLVDNIDEVKYNKYVTRHGHPRSNNQHMINGDDNYWTI